MNFKDKWRRKENFKVTKILKKKVNMKKDNKKCLMKKLKKKSRNKSQKRR